MDVIVHPCWDLNQSMSVPVAFQNDRNISRLWVIVENRGWSKQKQLSRAKEKVYMAGFIAVSLNEVSKQPQPTLLLLRRSIPGELGQCSISVE